jgi:protein-S-isoprenylcysteine O-methyltransferase Ste14
MKRSAHDTDNAGVIAPPPLLYAAFGLAGIGLNALFPLVLTPDWAQAAGVLCIALSLVPGPWALVVMLRAGVNPEPSHSTSALVTHGPFRFTRNPIYLTFTLFFFGVALVTRNAWLLVMLIPLLALMHWGVIFREERYLARRFGLAYSAYRERVRRWL